MLVRRPLYFQKFRCKASDCSDTCCAGWEIDIDPEKAEVYRQTAGKLGAKLRTSMQYTDGIWSFRMNEGRCPFLNRENLCEIILDGGSSMLCTICREHPRFYEWFGNYREEGLGNCCEEAVRLLMEQEEKISYEIVEEESEESAEELSEEERQKFLFLRDARDTAILLIQNRDMELEIRMTAVLLYACELQQMMDEESWNEIPDLNSWYLENGVELARQNINQVHKAEKSQFLNLIHLYESLEHQSVEWESMLKQLKDFCLRNSQEKINNLRDQFCEQNRCRFYEYEHLAVYGIDRYFMKSLFDGEVLSKVKLALLSVLMTGAWDWMDWCGRGILCTENRQLHAKIYAKEIEYNIENIRNLEIESWRKECLSERILIAILKK